MMSHERLYTSVSVDNVTCLVRRDTRVWPETSAGEHLSYNFRCEEEAARGVGKEAEGGAFNLWWGPDGGGVSEFELT